MINNTRKRYRLATVITVLLLGILLSGLYIVNIRDAGDIYKEYATESILDNKRIFLKDTVNNVIHGIEDKKTTQASQLHHTLVDEMKMAAHWYTVTPSEFPGNLIHELEPNAENSVFSALIYNSRSNQILYNTFSQQSFSGLPEQLTSQIKESCPVWEEQVMGNWTILLGVTKSTMDERVKSLVHDELHRLKFDNGGYIWVNEIVNYEGGDDYAIRRVHPNLKDTEGMLLSTNMTDIKGNTPYLTELEGVKKYGEVFFTYYFKKLNSEDISQKLTFARLYKEYDWVIAMGVHLDDVDSYVAATTSKSDSRVKQMLWITALVTGILLAAAFLLTGILERWYYKKSYGPLSDAAYKDSLTQAYNRRAGEEFLSNSFSEFLITGQSPALIMMDIDDFKKVNDGCGHQKGDEILKTIIQTLKDHSRISDYVIRWGGEEFLLIANGLREEDVDLFANKLLAEVEKNLFICKEKAENIQVTISMGISYFNKTDLTPEEGLERADAALYQAKAEGKNRACKRYESV